eukprot:320104_1
MENIACILHNLSVSNPSVLNLSAPCPSVHHHHQTHTINQYQMRCVHIQWIKHRITIHLVQKYQTIQEYKTQDGAKGWRIVYFRDHGIVQILYGKTTGGGIANQIKR